MKVVILAGGFGSRLSEETKKIPKPLIKIGKKPLIWHIMKHFSFYNFREFLICTGYLGYMFEDYFKKNLKTKEEQSWKIKCVNTGLDTLTGGRIKSVAKYLKKEKHFFLTYGDGISNINLKKLLHTHTSKKKIATISCVIPPARYGSVIINQNSLVKKFQEKVSGGGYINGGFFVLTPKIFNFIKNKKDSFEFNTLPKVVQKKELNSYIHNGFWYAVDTIREKFFLLDLIKMNKAKWMIWKK